MSRPRLLVVASTFPAHPQDGTPAFVRDLAVETSREFDTAVLVPRVPGGASQESLDGLSVTRFAYFPRRHEDLADGAILENLRADRSRWAQVPAFLAAETWALRAAVRRFRPDVVHLHWMIPQGLSALLAARGVPWLVTTLGGDVYALRDPVSRRLKGAVLRRAGAVTTMNTDMRERLVALGAPPERTHVMPMGADLGGVRAHAGPARIPGRLLFVGRLVEKKGAVVLLEALRRLPPDLPWSAEIVGDGPLRVGLEAQAAGLPVHFVGQAGRAELYRRYHEATVVVVPSVAAASGDQDGLPLVLCEAMGAGAAVVGSRLAGIDEAVEHGRSGLLVPPGDPAALATALQDLLGDPARAAALGAAAAVRVEQFSLPAVGRRYRDLLRSIIEERT